ncbi:MAG: tRNA (adenosine(37)-N6)-threonylcarbamoyltransferase complex dimerization subunit type 1 TsaB [Nitrospira sp.]|nr:tRNA (adenosine(37)-N6)-threonylcarbamoyltransferase complex dimerization subunit type 1 TsaB [Nitrospira sp.]
MKILAIETATAWQSVAILEENRVLARQDQDASGAHGTLLLPAIERLLMETQLRLNDLDGLACSAGPGSFTGIRVGLATCLGLRAATGLPLVLVPTLEAMAWGVTSSVLPICPIVTSRRGELYWAVFRRTGDDQLHRLMTECVGPPAALARSLTEHTLVFGDGWSAMNSQIRAALPVSVMVSVSPLEVKPSAASVAVLGMQRFRRGDIAGNRVEPLYVQRAEAELQYDRSGGVSPVMRRQERVTNKIAQRLARGRQGRQSATQLRRKHA